MLHFSCDLCGCQLKEQRFVAKMNVYPTFDPEDIDEDILDADHLQQISETLKQMEVTGKSELDDCEPKMFRFDLCPHCHQKFLKDPLGRDAFRRVNFSEN